MCGNFLTYSFACLGVNVKVNVKVLGTIGHAFPGKPPHKVSHAKWVGQHRSVLILARSSPLVHLGEVTTKDTKIIYSKLTIWQITGFWFETTELYDDICLHYSPHCIHVHCTIYWQEQHLLWLEITPAGQHLNHRAPPYWDMIVCFLFSVDTNVN